MAHRSVTGVAHDRPGESGKLCATKRDYGTRALAGATCRRSGQSVGAAAALLSGFPAEAHDGDSDVERWKGGSRHRCFKPWRWQSSPARQIASRRRLNAAVAGRVKTT